jgi:hypothetical protein
MGNRSSKKEVKAGRASKLTATAVFDEISQEGYQCDQQKVLRQLDAVAQAALAAARREKLFDTTVSRMLADRCCSSSFDFSEAQSTEPMVGSGQNPAFLTCGLVSMFSSPDGSGMLQLAQAISSCFCAMDAPPCLTEHWRTSDSCREFLDLSAVSEYLGEPAAYVATPSGSAPFHFGVAVLPHTFAMEDELSACWLGQVPSGQRWPEQQPSQQAEILDRSLADPSSSGLEGDAVSCGLVVIHACMLARIKQFHKGLVASMPHYTAVFCDRYASTVRRLSPQNSQKRKETSKEESLCSLPFMVVVTHVEAFAEMEKICVSDDMRLLLYPSYTTASEDSSLLHPILQLRDGASEVFGIPKDRVALIGWLSGGVRDWNDVGDPRVVVLRRLLLHATSLGTDFLRSA